MYPSQLEAQLRNIRSRAETAIQETGANILYLAFGFLEWSESKDSDISRHAPLYLVPAKLTRSKLDKATGAYSYTLEYTGEDIIPNLSLREKLKVDFGMALPELDENTLPETYFKDVQKLIEQNQPRWKVRRYCTLALLNFGKLLMYLDLDPKRWPDGARNIANHPIVSRFFSSSTESEKAGGESLFSEEYEIDEIPDVHEIYPLIDDADSSQHSALIDALKGKNLIIEGPPGTGKSQTITNLIAAAISQGKKVLFVAEKLAALQVVKRRLDQAGLGDFCLELHSHKTQKRQVIESISDRLKKHTNYRNPADIEVDIKQYESYRIQLTQYAKLVNMPWESTGKSIHEILMAATRYREELGINPTEIHPQEFDLTSLTPSRLREISDAVHMYDQVCREVLKQLQSDDDITSHPWYGIENQTLQIFDATKVCDELRQWTETLTKLLAYSNLAAEQLNAKAGEIGTLAKLEDLSSSMEMLPTLQGNEDLDSLPLLRGDALDEFDVYIGKYEKLQAMYLELEKKISKRVIEEQGQADHIKKASESILEVGITEVTSIDDLVQQLQFLNNLGDRLEKAKEPLAEITEAMGVECLKLLKPDPTGFAEFEKLLRVSNDLQLSFCKYRADCFDGEEIDDLLDKLSTEIEHLKPLRESLYKDFNLFTLPNQSDLDAASRLLETKKGFFRFMSGEWRKARKLVKSISLNPKAKIDYLIGCLPSLLEYKQGYETFSKEASYPKFLGELFRDLDTQVDDCIQLRDWYKLVRKEYGIGFGKRVVLGSALIKLPIESLRGLQSLHTQGFLEDIKTILSDIERLKENFKRLSILDFENTNLIGQKSSIAQLAERLGRALDLYKLAFDEGTISLSEIIQTSEALITFQARKDKFELDALNSSPYISHLGLKISPSDDQAKKKDRALATQKLAHLIARGSSDLVKRYIHDHPTQATFSTLKELSKKVLVLIADEQEKATKFSGLTGLNIEQWQVNSGDDLRTLIARNNRANDNPAWLANWVEFFRFRSKLDAIGFRRLLNKLESRELDLDCIEKAYLLGTYDLLVREILHRYPELEQFSGMQQEAVQERFCTYDNKLKYLQREKIAWKTDQCDPPKGISGGRVSELSELSLLEYECGKKKRHISMRNLLRDAGSAISSIKPCFMMGPMAISQYLVPGEHHFDLVVMDEASQIKPEDALGSIARGQQIVVVGDPKQLPPTRFFDKLVEEEEEDTTSIQESESILDATLPMFAQRRLRWHYRSQHESLIAFSNHSFYNGDLVIFPSPYSDSDDYGVKLSNIPGRFLNRRNIEEAKVIAEAVERHLLNRPHESLGVIAMNAEQQDQIERAVIELSKENNIFLEALERNSGDKEPLIIKNLENVQGDERDVIFISFTYGPQQVGGQVMQRFGPITSDTGWRRLNVLFTRAKKRMHVFSSMDADKIIVTERSSRGVKALKDFLAFAKSGIIHQPEYTGRSADSDFEISVSKALFEKGFECEYQVGVAGFYIDLAVKDPGNPGKFLMGIECDGATYHSAKSARDRDRLRQSVLEELGWRIKRIWSTDWYKNSEAQLIPVLNELNKLKTESAARTEIASEVDELEDIIAEAEEDEQKVEPFISEAVSLKEKLEHFNEAVIIPAEPNTDPNKRLLRPAMIEALVEYQPMSKSEFFEYILAYLRQGTDPVEGKYLEQVIEIIAGEELGEIES